MKIFEFDCPFCDGKTQVFLGEKVNGATHTVPTCRMFEELAPDDYLWEVNEKLGLHMKN